MAVNLSLPWRVLPRGRKQLSTLDRHPVAGETHRGVLPGAPIATVSDCKPGQNRPGDL